MSGRGVAIAACAGGPALAGLATGAYAFGRWWTAVVQRLLDTPISERESRASNPDLKDAR